MIRSRNSAPASVRLLERRKTHSLEIAGVRVLVGRIGVVLQHHVEILGGGFVILLGVMNHPDVILRVGREGPLIEVLQVVGEFGERHIVVAGLVVAEGVLVHVHRGHGRRTGIDGRLRLAAGRPGRGPLRLRRAAGVDSGGRWRRRHLDHLDGFVHIIQHRQDFRELARHVSEVLLGCAEFRGEVVHARGEAHHRGDHLLFLRAQALLQAALNARDGGIGAAGGLRRLRSDGQEIGELLVLRLLQLLDQVLQDGEISLQFLNIVIGRRRCEWRRRQRGQHHQNAEASKHGQPSSIIGGASGWPAPG